ncbi:MAG: hypothetical protein AVDCRST_MAG08-2044, partial [uncultured Acetobacteraceae bacterium]
GLPRVPGPGHGRARPALPPPRPARRPAPGVRPAPGQRLVARLRPWPAARHHAGGAGLVEAGRDGGQAPGFGARIPRAPARAAPARRLDRAGRRRHPPRWGGAGARGRRLRRHAGPTLRGLPAERLRVAAAGGACGLSARLVAVPRGLPVPRRGGRPLPLLPRGVRRAGHPGARQAGARPGAPDARRRRSAAPIARVV